MKIDLKEIGASDIAIVRTITAAQFLSAGDVGTGELRLLSDALLHLDVKRAGERFHLRGTLEAEVELECSRCLTPFSFAVRPAFDYYLVPRRHVEEWAEVEIDETSRHEVEVDSLVVDLLRLAEEQVRLGLPMKPLCAEACRGICLGCGADLNREECTCGETRHGAEGSGLEVLSGLLEEMKNESSGH
jgi:uncharacterized protein